MNTYALRPWGRLQWLLPKLPSISKWSFLGCLSTEDRCLSTFDFISYNELLSKALFLEVIDSPSRYSTRSLELLQSKRTLLASKSTVPIDIISFNLFDPVYRYLNEFQLFLENAGDNLIVDLSSFPKKFFFPLLKFALLQSNLSSLIITYTLPQGYPEEPLAEDFSPWRHLPAFGPTDLFDEKPDMAIVGIGYMPLGLPSLLKEQNIADVRMLLPFPPGPSGKFNYKNWLFLEDLRKDFSNEIKDPIRVDPIDVSSIYNCILSQTNNGVSRAILAPFGPKPMSIAMCLYASFAQSVGMSIPVYYSQPQYYNPSYSIGVSKTQGVIDSFAYCIRLGGNNLYKFSPQ